MPEALHYYFTTLWELTVNLSGIPSDIYSVVLANDNVHINGQSKHSFFKCPDRAVRYHPAAPQIRTTGFSRI